MLTFDQGASLDNFDSYIKLLTCCHLNATVGYNNSSFHLFQMGKVVHHNKLATGRVEAQRIYKMMMQ